MSQDKRIYVGMHDGVRTLSAAVFLKRVETRGGKTYGG